MAYNNNFKRNNTNNNGDRRKAQKPTYVDKKIYLGSSNFYMNNLTELYNLLDQITFDLVAVPVTMARSVAFANKTLEGHVTVGTVKKFTNNTFTVSMQEKYADKINDESVIIVNCRKNYETGEFTYVTGIYITRGTPVTAEDEELFAEESEETTEDTAVEESTSDETSEEEVEEETTEDTVEV